MSDAERTEGSAEAQEQVDQPQAAENGESAGEAASLEQIDLSQLGPRDLQPREIVEGVVAAVTDEGVAVDVGAKYEGVVPIAEFSADDLPKVGDRIEVMVLRVDEDNGIIRLSKRRADYERLWDRLYRAQETGEVITAMVTERVKGGLRVDVGVPGFVPASQVATRDPRNLDRFVGREIRLKVLEVDRQKKKVILTHKQVVEEERERRRQETLAKLYEGAIVEGRVRSITDYGAFIDLGGVDGLLHISELSWVRVNHPSEVLRKGQRIKVMVLSIEEGGERISLGRKQVLPDPWTIADKKIKVGQMLRARVSRVVRTGAFARIEGIEGLEIEGFIPAREVSARRQVLDVREHLRPGDVVEVKVIDMNPQARRLTLSIAEAEEEKERQEVRKLIEQQRAEIKPRTLGEILAQSGVLEQLKAVEEEAEEEEASEQGEAAEAEAPSEGEEPAGQEGEEK